MASDMRLIMNVVVGDGNGNPGLVRRLTIGLNGLGLTLVRIGRPKAAWPTKSSQTSSSMPGSRWKRGLASR